jgi:hypothetical protein
MIKKTVSVRLGLEDYTIALMNKNGWKEIERSATGGQMSEERLQITFEGYDTDYQENDYIKVVANQKEGYFHFYSLRRVDGYYTNSLEIFEKYHNEAKTNFEICSFGVVQ